MYGDESLEARQKSEYEALSAIYAEDIKDLRAKSAWGKWTPLNLVISLTPQQGNSGIQEIFARLDLHVVCSETYPNSPPKILLENGKGLSNALIIELQGQLEFKAHELKGQEMIFELCQHVQEFLHRHNKPTSKSFYDEMLKRQKEKEEKDLQEKQMVENKQRQNMMEEIQRRREMLISESKLRREYRCNSENSEEEYDFSKKNVSLMRRNNSSTESSDDSLCDHKGTISIDFHHNGHRRIQRGRCIKHSNENHIVYIGIDKESGEIVIISEWCIQLQENTDPALIQRQLSSIEQEINYLTKLKHQNLAHYQNITHERVKNKIVVYILSEFVYGSNCASIFSNQQVGIDVQFLKYIARGVLNALDYLHRNNVFHRDIKDTCVYLSDKGAVKVTNFSIHKRMSDLIFNIPSHGSANYSKKTDIYKFGLFVLSLLRGRSPAEENVNVPDNLPPDLHDFLSRCLIKDEKERYTATQLLNHEFFRDKLLPQLPRKASAEKEVAFPEPHEVVHSDILTLPQSNSQSRISNEFEFLQHLGKGAYGDVIKVRNKLDGGYYAIKRIQLNPKNKQLNKKIVREVMLLSRLNHENVVRYYNSWIETTVIKREENSRRSSSSDAIKVPKVVRQDEFSIKDNIEALAPPIKNVEVSITYDSKSQAIYSTSSDEDSNDEDEAWAVNYNDESDSDGIEFERESDSGSKETQSQEDETILEDESTPSTQIDFMYIQMEFCEKSTLRTAIDNNLYTDEDRVWRLFREIVEGLAHIHQQGMIHRDLKPVNIFLDSEDHVKIGDFGLATTNFKSKMNEFSINMSTIENEGEESLMDESKTGLVGTALYVAPEISVATKAIYNQKVDIYSLGIIFFEMCYKPLSTNMERIKILTGLRKKEIVLPDDFNEGNKMEKQSFLIRWFLDHDISKRPTSQELLQSEFVPPPVLEECELRELVRHTLSNPHLKGYKYLIASCFKQSFTPAQDITYDKDLSLTSSVRPLQIYDYVKQIIIRIFKQHGGQNFSTPLLMPKSKYYDNVESCVRLMTHFGGVVTLPHDLRVPFARYIAWNNISLFRRFSIERVYREKKVFGFMPRELYECAFDIVTSTSGNLMADAEVLYIVYEIINELPKLRNKSFLIRLNHTSLIKAVLLYCGVKDKHSDVCANFSAAREGKIPKLQLQAYLISLGLSDNSISTLLGILNSEFEVSKAMNHLQMITKKKSGEASQLAKQALQELKCIAQNAEAFGVTFDIIIAPGLVYNVQQYSGMICQYCYELKKKHKHATMEVIAAGGRYDSMIAYYRKIMEHANCLGRDISQSAVGISISLDKLVQALQKEHDEDEDDLPPVKVFDTVVCSVGNKLLLKEKAKILRNLWSAGIKCCLIESTNIEEIQEQCDEIKVPHVIMLKDSEQGTVRIRSWDRDRFHEKTVNISDLVENMQRIIKSWNGNQLESSQVQTTIVRSDSKSNYSEKNHEPNVAILFVTVDKMSSNAKKRYENQIRSQLNELFDRLLGYVIVLGIHLETNIIRTLSSYLEFDSEEDFQRSVSSVIEKHQRHKKYIGEICDEIYDQKLKSSKPLIILYSLSDAFHKLID